MVADDTTPTGSEVTTSADDGTGATAANSRPRRRATSPAGTPTAGAPAAEPAGDAASIVLAAMSELDMGLPPGDAGTAAPGPQAGDTDDVVDQQDADDADDVDDADETDRVDDADDAYDDVEDDDIDDVDIDTDDDVDGDAAERDAAAPGVSVLFRPPAREAPRRRRAVAPAGPASVALFSPPPDEDADTPDGTDDAGDFDDGFPTSRGRRGGQARRGPAREAAGEPGEDTEDDLDSPDEESADDVADQGDDSGEGKARKRRRRGGRGRRRKSAQDADAESDTDSDAGPDAGSDADPDAADADADGEDGGAEDASDEDQAGGRRRRRKRGRARSDGDAADGTDTSETDEGDDAGDDGAGDTEDSDDPNLSRSARRRRRRRRRGSDSDGAADSDSGPDDHVASVRGSTRLEAKRQRRREGRDSHRRRTVITEAEFLARRESVERTLLVRERGGRTQVAVLEDGVLVEHHVALASHQSMIGNVYLGKVQNVLPSMEAAFVDIGRGRNAVLYAGEVNWDAVGLTAKTDRRIEAALRPGDPVLVQVTKDPIGHKGARLTSQISLPGRFLVLVPESSMTGISRKLPDTERNRLKKVLKRVLPEKAGVIVRTAAEGAAEEELERDVARLTAHWDDIQRKATSVSAPALLYGEPDLAIRVVRDVFNEDINSLVVSGDDAWTTLEGYVSHVAPELRERVQRWEPAEGEEQDIFAAKRIDEQIAKALERKVWLPSGGSLVIDRTEAMTVVDVNTGKFTGSGGDLEETVTRNNLEAAEEIVRQLRLRDVGGIIVVDFIDMVLESNRQLVLRRLVECLGRDRTKHQVAEVTSLGLVQMTRKRVGQGLHEAFTTACEHCHGRGVLVHDQPVTAKNGAPAPAADSSARNGPRGRRGFRTDQPG